MKTDSALVEKIREHARLNPEDSYKNIALRYGTSGSTVKRLCRDLGRTKGWRRGRASSSCDPAAFWARVDRKGSGCWNWLAGKNSSGYGGLAWGGQTVGAHRIAYELEKGPIPPGLEVHHHCENRLCCNPAHLMTLTHRENMDEAGIIKRRKVLASSARVTFAFTEGIDTRALASKHLGKTCDSIHVNTASISPPFVPMMPPVSIPRKSEMIGAREMFCGSDPDAAVPQRSGITTQDLTPAVFLLQKKSQHRNNIVIGEDEAQLAFIAGELDTPIEEVDRVTDDMLVGQSGHLYKVFARHRIDLSPEMRSKTGFWSAEPITKGSAAINVIVKCAAATLPYKGKLTREQVDIIGDQVVKTRIVDVNAAITEAMWLMTGEIKRPERWPEPWEQPIRWVNSETMDVEYRLNTLYKKLVGYATYLSKGPDAAKALGIKPHQVQKYKELTLDLTKVYQTIKALSQWKEGYWKDQFICAGIICSIWI